jgi:enoyl-CoA hydratase/carnithine racemase
MQIESTQVMGGAEAGAELRALLAAQTPDAQAIERLLDRLKEPERIAATRSLDGRAQKKLWYAADGFRGLTLADIVPPNVPALTQVRHYGKNSQPAFTQFEKRFFRPEGQDPRAPSELGGANFQVIQLLTGPGYYTAHNSTSRPGEVVLDYRRVPVQKPADWPRIVKNQWGRGAIFYGSIDLATRCAASPSTSRSARATASWSRRTSSSAARSCRDHRSARATRFSHPRACAASVLLARLRRMIDMQIQDGIHVLRMTAGENRFNWAFLDALNAALDAVERAPELQALVTVGEGKFYSNGLDLEWMGGPGRQQAAACVERVHALLMRMLTFPTITVAALNGHTFAAGAMLALAHDFRVMRTDRGFFCLPEADIRIPFTEPMAAVIQARLSKATAHEAMTTGKRYTADEALRAAIVQQAAPEAEVLRAAHALAKAHAGKHGSTLATIKKTMYRDVLQTLDAPRSGNPFAVA